MRKFLELTVAGEAKKKLFIPSESVLSYEQVPKNKNEVYPNEGSFLRYDYGEGLQFAIVTEKMKALKAEIGTEGFLSMHLLDDAEILVREHLVLAIQETEDEGIAATRLSLNLNGQVGSLVVKEPASELVTS